MTMGKKIDSGKDGCGDANEICHHSRFFRLHIQRRHYYLLPKPSPAGFSEMGSGKIGYGELYILFINYILPVEIPPKPDWSS